MSQVFGLKPRPMLPTCTTLQNLLYIKYKEKEKGRTHYQRANSTRQWYKGTEFFCFSYIDAYISKCIYFVVDQFHLLFNLVGLELTNYVLKSAVASLMNFSIVWKYILSNRHTEYNTQTGSLLYYTLQIQSIHVEFVFYSLNRKNQLWMPSTLSQMFYRRISKNPRLLLKLLATLVTHTITCWCRCTYVWHYIKYTSTE